MARSLNKVILIGYLGRDPEMRFTPNAKSVANFSVACNRSWQSADGTQHTETEWFNIIAWGELAEVSKKFLAKGSLVYVEGRLQTRTWEDSNGEKHRSIEVVARDILLLQSTKNSIDESEDHQASDDEEYPF
jgi:single-strand DNA-binding protein